MSVSAEVHSESGRIHLSLLFGVGSRSTANGITKNEVNIRFTIECLLKPSRRDVTAKRKRVLEDAKCNHAKSSPSVCRMRESA